jgi:hypothetical protein
MADQDQERAPTLAGINISLQMDPRQYRVLNDKLDILGQEHVMLNQKLDQILFYLTLPVRLQLTLTKTSESAQEKGDNDMGAAKKGKFKLVLVDSGKGGVATLTPVDAAGLATSLTAGTTAPVITSSDPTAIVVDQSADPSGLTATFKPATPPKLATGVTLTATATDPSGAALTGVSEAISVTAGPAGSFVMAVVGS